MFENLAKEAVGLRLGRIKRNGDLTLCEAIRFDDGRDAVHVTLRRAALSGRVEIEGNIENHLADVLNDNGDLVQTIALDRDSYSALKNHWMRCKVERL